MRFIVTTLAAAVLATGLVASSVAAPAAPEQRKRNIVQTAVAAGQLTTLASLLEQAGLAKTLQGKGPFTVFAPTDAAFAKVPASTLSSLAKDKKALRGVLLYHVVAGKVPAAKVVKLESAKTVNGQSVSIRVRNGTVFVNRAKVTTPDVMASNGVIHVIDKVLIPKSS